MSIIDDALNRLQEQRSDGGDSRDKGLGSPLPNIKGAVGGRKKGRGFLGFGAIAIVTVVIAGVIWVALDRTQKKQIEQARSFSESSMPTPKPVKAVEPSTDTLPLSEKLMIDEKATAAINEVKPVKADIIERSAVVKKVEPVKEVAAEPKFTPIEKPVSAAPVEVEQKPVAEAVEIEKPIEPDSIETLSEVTDGDWLAAGRKVLEKDGLLAGCDMWEEGLKGVPQSWIVLVAGVFKGPVYAERAYRRLGSENFPLIVRHEYQGAEAYYVLSAPPIEDIEKVRKRVKRKMDLKAVKGNFVSKFTGNAFATTITKPPVAKTSGKSQAKKRVAIKKKAKAPAPVTKVTKKAVKKKKYLGRVGSEKERIDQAQKYVARGAFYDALEVLQPMFVSPPRKWQPYFLIGTAHLGLGNLEKADSYLIQGLAVDGKQTGLWVQRAVVAQQRGLDEMALRFLSEAERLDPTLPEVQLNKGFSNDKLGRVAEAVKAYRSFLSLTEGNQAFTEVRRYILDRLAKLGY